MTLEWLLAAPLVLLLGLGALQWSLLFQARGALTFALQQAAREASFDHAQPSAVSRGLARGLIPYWSLAGPGQSLDLFVPVAQMRLAQETAAGALVWRQISPSRESFSDWARPGRDAAGDEVPGRLEIPNDDLAYADSQVGAASGQTLRDANLLKLELRYGVPLRVPLIGFFAVRLMEMLEGCTGAVGMATMAASGGATTGSSCSFYRAADASGRSTWRWPVQVVATARMQSAAWPSDQTPARRENPQRLAGGSPGIGSGPVSVPPDGTSPPGEDRQVPARRDQSLGNGTSTSGSDTSGGDPGPVDNPSSATRPESSGNGASARQLSEAILSRGPGLLAACRP